MEFAKQLKKMCEHQKHFDDIGYDYNIDDHSVCVYRLRWSDLVQNHPEHEDMLRKCWLLTTCDPIYLELWDGLQQAYPNVPGLKELGNLGALDPNFHSLMEKIRDLDSSPNTWLSNEILSEDFSTWPTIHNAEVWNLTEGLNFIVSYRSLSLLCGKSPINKNGRQCFDDFPKDVLAAAKDPDVISFCEELRYYN